MNRKRYSKRVLSLILSVLMIISIIPIGMVQSSAASDTPWLAMYEYQSSDYSKVDNNNVIQLFKGGVLNTNEKKGTYSCTKTPNLVFVNSLGEQFRFPKSGDYEIDGSHIYFKAVYNGANFKIRAKLHYEDGRICKIDSFNIFMLVSNSLVSPSGTYPNQFQTRTYYKSPITIQEKSLLEKIVSAIFNLETHTVFSEAKPYTSGNYSSTGSSGTAQQSAAASGLPDANKILRVALNSVGTSYASGWCLAWVGDAFGQAYGKWYSRANCAVEYRNKISVQSLSMDNIPVGAVVFFSYSNVFCDDCRGSCSHGSHRCGHIGISVGDGYMVSAYGGTIYKETVANYSRKTNNSYCGWGWMNNEPLSSAVQNTAPSAPSISLPKQEIALDDSVTVNWNSIGNADYYDIVTDNGALATGLSKSTTSYSVKANLLGNHWVKVVAVNKVGSAESSRGYFTVHAPSTVTFKNWDGTVNEYQEVPYGYKPVAPSDVPEREGYTFNGWDGVDNAVYADTVINAKYTRNKYLVNFYKYVKNADGTRTAVRLGNTQKIYYGEDAVAPDASTFDLPDGHVFAGWSDKYENIKENKNIYLVDKWYNDNMSVLVSNLVAVRDDDGTGYTVTLKVTNNDTALTSGRVIVALKTSEEKLVETTESSAFSLKAGASKELEIFIPSTRAASLVDAFAVEKFETAIPISVTQRADIQVNESNLWTDWSTEAPPADALNTQTKTEYRNRSKQYTYSGIATLEGFEGKSRVLAGTDYSPWKREYQNFIANSYDTNYEYERSEDTKTANLLYFYWSSSMQKFWYTRSANYDYYYEIYAENPGTVVGYDSGSVPFLRTGPSITVGSQDGTFGEIYYIISDHGEVNNFTATGRNETLPYPGGERTIYRVKTNKYHYQYWKWGDWTDWGDTKLNFSGIFGQLLSNNKQQEERTVYRYVPKDALGVEDNSGIQRNVHGALSADYAGQQATLFVYKYDEASDWTNEYVGQCIIADDGTYNFDFILRDEPTVKTGDYRVTLGIEGTDMVINLAPIKAPVEQFTVNYYNTDGTILSTQTVNKGDSAVIPDTIPEQVGYTFTGWSESNTAIKENLDIFPVMQINTYNVVFIDWEHQTYEMKQFNYGDALEGPAVPDTEDKYFAGWDIAAEGTTLVTENMVACAQFETKTFDVKFYDWEGNEIKSETVEYGGQVEAPELDELGVYIFDGWSTYDYYFVKDSLDIYPVFHFENTVENPTADIDTGIYDETQTVTLSCATEDAEIYYTVDGSDPAENGTLYTAPIEIAKSTTLKFVAKKAECNNSNVITKCYAINKADMGSDWMTFAELPQEVVDNPSEYTMLSNIGYKYKDTMSTTSVALRDQLLADGWTLEDTGWTDYSEYSQTYPEYPDNEIEILSRDGDLVEKFFYNYSHYKYVDADTGETVCKPSAVEGTSGETETIKLDDVLTVSKFVDGKAGYSYNGELWFNQEVTSEMVDPGFDVYSYRSKIFNLYKWTDWNVTAPSSSDTRERQSDTVFKYIIPNEYIVTLDYSKSELTGKQNETMLVREGKTLTFEDNFFDATGYVFDGLFTDEDCTTEWNIESDTVSQSITLYAKHTMQTFTVKFLNYDGAVISEQTVQYLHFSEIPEDPQRDGYVFVGWEVTAGTESGNDGVSSDVEYTAKYVAEEDYVRVSLSRSKLSMMTGSSTKITVTLSSPNATDSEVYIYSSNPEIATVEQDGTITAVHSGTAVITALSLDTYESANCVVTVLGSADTEILPVSNSGITVDPSAKYLLGVTKDNNTIGNISDMLENTGLIYTNPDGTQTYDENDTSRHVGTGYRIRLEDGGFLIDELEIVVSCDINGDGAVDAFDLFSTDMFLNDLLDLSGSFFAAADTDCDGTISLADYIVIRSEL